jgi:hypothetical protein
MQINQLFVLRPCIESRDYFADYMFTDVIFLSSKSRLFKSIYKYHHIFLYEYPALCYVAPIFEARIHAYMLVKNFLRLGYKNIVYNHEDLGASYPKLTKVEFAKKILYPRLMDLYSIFFNSIQNRNYNFINILKNVVKKLKFYQKMFRYWVTIIMTFRNLPRKKINSILRLYEKGFETIDPVRKEWQIGRYILLRHKQAKKFDFITLFKIL